jgi:uncharacterized membrane protein (UPF0127 family)
MHLARAGLALVLALGITVAVTVTGTGAGCKNSQQMSAGASAGSAVAARVNIPLDGGRTAAFRVELARTEAEREQGLMYRDRMDTDAGMLFIFERAAPLTFWMKNTFIPLDMIFIGADRHIVGIVENAEPRTLSARRVAGTSVYVLEIGGGLSAKLGIHPGASVDFSGVPNL